jgi:hypothetical protein
MGGRTVRQSAVSFMAKELGLEGMVAQPGGDSGPLAGAAACHPHPLSGGGRYWFGHAGRPAPPVAGFFAETLK